MTMYHRCKCTCVIDKLLQTMCHVN
jgi:hypothetical protein